jgi:hypothetical protein
MGSGLSTSGFEFFSFFGEPGLVSPVRLTVASAFRPQVKAEAMVGRTGRPPSVEPELRSGRGSISAWVFRCIGSDEHPAARLSSSVRELNHLFGDRPHADVTMKKPFEERLHSP